MFTFTHTCKLSPCWKKRLLLRESTDDHGSGDASVKLLLLLVPFLSYYTRHPFNIYQPGAKFKKREAKVRYKVQTPFDLPTYLYFVSNL